MNGKDLKGLTALHHAARNYQVMPLKTGIFLIMFDAQAKFITMIIKQGMPVDIKDKKQLTAMHHAIHGNSLDAVKALCEAGADITMEDMEGRRYMEYASMYGSYNILVWFAKKFPELYINDETKETILHFAASQGLTEVLNLQRMCIRILYDAQCLR